MSYLRGIEVKPFYGCATRNSLYRRSLNEVYTKESFEHNFFSCINHFERNKFIKNLSASRKDEEFSQNKVPGILGTV